MTVVTQPLPEFLQQLLTKFGGDTAVIGQAEYGAAIKTCNALLDAMKAGGVKHVFLPIRDDEETIDRFIKDLDAKDPEALSRFTEAMKKYDNALIPQCVYRPEATLDLPGKTLEDFQENQAESDRYIADLAALIQKCHDCGIYVYAAEQGNGFLQRAGWADAGNRYKAARAHHETQQKINSIETEEKNWANDYFPERFCDKKLAQFVNDTIREKGGRAVVFFLLKIIFCRGFSVRSDSIYIKTGRNFLSARKARACQRFTGDR